MPQPGHSQATTGPQAEHAKAQAECKQCASNAIAGDQTSRRGRSCVGKNQVGTHEKLTAP